MLLFSRPLRGKEYHSFKGNVSIFLIGPEANRPMRDNNSLKRTLNPWTKVGMVWFNLLISEIRWGVLCTYWVLPVLGDLWLDWYLLHWRITKTKPNCISNCRSFCPADQKPFAFCANIERQGEGHLCLNVLSSSGISSRLVLGRSPRPMWFLAQNDAKTVTTTGSFNC